METTRCERIIAWPDGRRQALRRVRQCAGTKAQTGEKKTSEKSIHALRRV
jgi:hypothetical protein